MALITSQKQRYDIPHEPGQWVEVRPFTARDGADVEELTEGNARIQLGVQLLKRCVVAWSYDAEISEETIGQLDMDTFQWLMESINLTSGLRTSDEKKESNAGLSAQSSRLPPAASRRSLAT